MEDSDRSPSLPTAPDRTSPGGLEAYISGSTLVSSDGPAWKDLFVQILSRNRVQAPFLVPAVAEPLIVWVISGDVIVEERELRGDWMASRVEAGNFFLTRSATPYEMRWCAESDKPFKVMHLYLALPLCERAAREVLGATGVVGLKEISSGRDATLSQVLGLIHEALVHGDADALFVEGLALSLAAYLTRHYAVAGPAARPSNALSRSRLRQVSQFMDTHLDEPFDLKRLAQAVGMSEFHFSRLFKRATGLSPSLYFIRRRVANAQRLLQETDASIIEIGMAVGYSSPSHFAQVFRRETGVTPSDYRET
ncbi:helix-turn-helix domain-containing protein [Brucella pituitosa]|uniref:helix-turn-helix domain-containing protein n=1 Tax=Brucella pituitosa TaxID=571256 RepID=UPI003F4ADDDF